MRPPHVPEELRAGPFRRSVALAAGLTDDHLRSNAWRRLLHDVYAWHELPDSIALRSAAAALVLPPGGVVGYTAAAWLHGVDVRTSPAASIEVIVPRGWQLRRQGLRATSALLCAADVVTVGGIAVTSPERTAFDLARRRQLVEAVVGVDAMLNRGGCCAAALSAYVGDRAGWRGVEYARAALRHADSRSESPMESRMRMALVLEGLPRPECQVPVVDAYGEVFAVLDLGYERWRVGADYDGEPHEGRWRYDLARQERVRDAGWWHRRFTSADVRVGWSYSVRQVRAALLRAGWRP